VWQPRQDKTTLGPELFRCNACQTEYYLDTDDVTVRHQYEAPPAAPQAMRYGWAGIFLIIAVGVLTWLAVRHFQPGYFKNNSAVTIVAKPIFYLTNYVYADAERQLVYAILRTEGPRWGADSVTMYADFYDVRTGKLRREQVLEPLGRRLNNHSYEWHTFPGGQVYLLGNQHLYRVGHNPDRLLDVTTMLLHAYAPASSGIAEYKFDSRYEAL